MAAVADGAETADVNVARPFGIWDGGREGPRDAISVLLVPWQST